MEEAILLLAVLWVVGGVKVDHEIARNAALQDIATGRGHTTSDVCTGDQSHQAKKAQQVRPGCSSNLLAAVAPEGLLAATPMSGIGLAFRRSDCPAILWFANQIRQSQDLNCGRSAQVLSRLSARQSRQSLRMLRQKGVHGLGPSAGVVA